MKIHSDCLSDADLARALPPGVFVECSPQASRSRSAGYLVKLGAVEGGPGTAHPYRRNPGSSGSWDTDRADGVYAATYDEWGWWLARLYDQDPEMLAGPYTSREDFHQKTEGKYRRAA